MWLSTVPTSGQPGMVEAGKQFRRVNGHLLLRTLRAALERHAATAATENVIVGDVVVGQGPDHVAARCARCDRAAS